MSAPHSFKRLTRSDIPKFFSKEAVELILLAMEHGGLGRMSSKGHIIVRNNEGQTTWVSRNSGNGFKKIEDTASDIRKMFPSTTVERKVTTVVTTKMCSKCKHRKERSEFHNNKASKDGLQSYCKACMKIASDEAAARKKAREAAGEISKPTTASESPSPEVTAPEPPTVPEEPLTAWEAVQKAVSAEMVERIKELEEENKRLKRAIASVGRHVERVVFNAIGEEE